MAPGAADFMAANPFSGPEMVLPSLADENHIEAVAASARLSWASALQARRERNRAAAAAQRVARRLGGMPQAGRRLADRRAAVLKRSAAAPEVGQTLAASPQPSSRGRPAVPEADVSAGASGQITIPERSDADEAGWAQGARRGRSGAEAGWAHGASRGRSAASPDSGPTQGVRKPANSRGRSAAALKAGWSQRGRLQASSREGVRLAAPGADLSQGEMASLVDALGANANVLASSPPASTWQGGQGLQGLTQAHLETSRCGPGGAGQPDDQEADSAGLPHSSPAAASPAAAGRAAGKEADIPDLLPDIVHPLQDTLARPSKGSSQSAAADKAGQQGNAVITDSVESLPPADTKAAAQAAAQAAAEKTAGMSDTTEAASKAISDPDATQPTSPPPPHSQAPRSAAQSGGSQAVPGATTSGPWGSFGTTGPSHTEKSAAQEDADGTTATSKVR